MSPHPRGQRAGEQRGKSGEAARFRQDGEQIEGGPHEEEAHQPLHDAGPRPGFGQDAGRARPDGQHEIGKGHAEAGCRKDGHHDGQGLEGHPAEHAAEERTAARRRQQRGHKAREIGLCAGIGGCAHLEVEHGQGEDVKEGQRKQKDEDQQAVDDARILEEPPPREPEGAHADGEDKEPCEDARRKEDVVLAEMGEAFALVRVSRGGQERRDFHGQYGQHAGHDVEEQARQEAEDKRRPESRGLKRLLRKARPEMPLRRERLRRCGPGGRKGGLRRRRVGRGAGRGREGGGSGTVARLPIGGQGPGGQGGQGHGEVQADFLLDGNAVFVGTQQHGDFSRIGLLARLGGKRVKADEDRKTAAIGPDALVGIKGIRSDVPGWIKYADFGGAAFRPAHGHRGGKAFRFAVGVGVIPLGYRQPQDGQRMAVRIRALGVVRFHGKGQSLRVPCGWNNQKKRDDSQDKKEPRRKSCCFHVAETIPFRFFLQKFC